MRSNLASTESGVEFLLSVGCVTFVSCCFNEANSAWNILLNSAISRRWFSSDFARVSWRIDIVNVVALVVTMSWVSLLTSAVVVWFSRGGSGGNSFGLKSVKSIVVGIGFRCHGDRVFEFGSAFDVCSFAVEISADKALEYLEVVDSEAASVSFRIVICFRDGL